VSRTALLLCAVVAACSAPGYREPGESAAMQRAIEDENIATQVRMALADDPQTAPYESILVSCRKGVVTLEGGVGRAQVRERAVAIAQGIRGVVRVENSMRP